MNRDRCQKAKNLWFICDAVEKLDQTNRNINYCLLQDLEKPELNGPEWDGGCKK